MNISGRPLELEKRAAELGQHVQKILQRFQEVHSHAANAPHVNLNHQELRVIELLGEVGSVNMGGVAAHLSLAVNSVTSLIDGLEAKSLVMRQRSTEDRRVVQLELTESGREIHKAAESAKMELYSAMLRPLSSEEQELLLDLFRKVASGGQD